MLLPEIGPAPASSSAEWCPPDAGWTWPHLDRCSPGRVSSQTSRAAASTYKMGAPGADPAGKRIKTSLTQYRNLMIKTKHKMEVHTSLKSMMALAINFPKKRNFILILAMCAGLVVLPNGTANSPLELNMYFVPSWFPVEQTTNVTWRISIAKVSHQINIRVRMLAVSKSTFRICQSDLFTSPKTKIGSLKLLRHQSIKLLGGAQTCSNLKQIKQNYWRRLAPTCQHLDRQKMATKQSSFGCK